MKKIITYFKSLLVLFAVIMNISSCSKDDDEKTEKKELTVNPTSLAFTAEGGFKALNISADPSTNWEIVNTAGWVSFSKTSSKGNDVINVNVEANEMEEARTATFTVSSADKSISIDVSQSSLVVPFSVSSTTFEYPIEGGSTELTITAGSNTTWEITNIPAWLTPSQTSGTGSQTINLQVEENTNNYNYSSVITVETANESTDINVTQQYGGLYPSFNTNPLPADVTGMSSTAMELAAQMNLGWNIGNSLEATGAETAWGNPVVTKGLIDAVKLNGFNAVRIPCAWNQYLANEETAEIREDWLNRVKEVVQYCIDNDMYVLLNIHWDGGWLENNVTESSQEANNAKQKAFWEQIATHFRDFDEHLLFAGTNEPNVENATQMAVLNSYHQTFIDAVRSTGGKNAYRCLVVQGPSTDIEKTNTLMTTLPTDTAEDRMMVEVHYYTPWPFAGLTEDADWSDMFYYWGSGYESATDVSRNATWGLEDDLKNYFQLMKSQFIDNGIPVVLGEFGAIRRTTLIGADLELHLNSRAYYLKTVVQEAKVNGLIPFYWDEGSLGNHGFGIIDRSDNSVFDQQALDALHEGAN